MPILCMSTFILDIGHNKLFLSDNCLCVCVCVCVCVSDSGNAKAFSEMTQYFINRMTSVDYSLPRPWIVTRARNTTESTPKLSYLESDVLPLYHGVEEGMG
jgi:hypothetical protein